MTVLTSPIDLVSTDTSADWSDMPPRRLAPPRSEAQTTATLPLEQFQLEVSNLGARKDRYTLSAGPEFRARLADCIRTADDPRLAVEIVVSHCSQRPWQEKIYDGADVLAQVPNLVCQFVESDIANQRETEFADRAWLLATALAWADDGKTSERRARLLDRWRHHSDPTVREIAESAFEEMKR